MLAFRGVLAALGQLPGRGGRRVDADQLPGRVSAVKVPNGFQEGNGIRFRLQRGLAAAGVVNGRVGRLVLVFVVDGGENRPLGPCFRFLTDEGFAVSVQIPPVRQNDQMVQFGGRQRTVFFIRFLNEPVAEFLRGNVMRHAEDC